MMNQEKTMSEHDVSDIIDFAIDGNAVKIQDVVNRIMIDKVGEALANRKIEVAKSIFNSGEPDAGAE
jgi:hypothetical protein